MTGLTTFVGDSHSDAPWLTMVMSAAKNAGSDRLIQLGDFGLWPGRSGETFLNEVAGSLEHYDMELLFIDGNHDWHEQRLQFQPDEDGLVTVRPRLRFAPRGTVLELVPGVRALAIGGAPSIDRGYRTQGVSWWPEETVSYAEMERCIKVGQVDVVLAHDAPLGPHFRALAPWETGLAHRKLMSEIWVSARPRWWFSAHYHQRVSEQVYRDGLSTRFEILDCNISQESGFGWVTIDDEALRLRGDNSRISPAAGRLTKTISLISSGCN